MLLAPQTTADIGTTIPVHNPATQEHISSVPCASADDIAAAVATARNGARLNRRLPAHQRCTYLQRTAALILEHLDELREMMVAENGKSQSWADFEIRKTAEIFHTVAERSRDPQGETYPMDAMQGCESQMAMVYRQSAGVVGAIIPFNFPAEMLAYKAAAALAAGNSVVVKLSEDCPLTCLRIGELMREAGVPEEACRLLVGYGQAGEALVTHPDVPIISFTGSTAVGQHIMAKAAPFLKKLSLELGGNDPVIICADGDVEQAAQNLVRGRMTVGNGQACVADKRFIVHRSVVDQFIERGVEIVSQLRMGNPQDPAIDVGPLIHEKAASRVEAQIADAVSKGAEIMLGGKRQNLTFIEPTILGNVPKESAVFAEECFGPVAPVLSFDDEEEALEIANASPYGLQGCVYSKDISRALRMADDMDVGGVVVNGSSCFRPGNVPYLPRKASGLGSDNMFHCFEEMTYGKAVVIDGIRR